MKKQNKSFKIILTLCCFLAFSISALASNPQAPPVTGIGVVVKKNPGGGASKATTGKDGSFSLELVKGSYLVSLDKDQLLKAGQELATSLNPKSKYLFNGDGTQLVITDNENIIMSQLEGNIGTDLMLITVTQTTTLQGSLLWDSTVVNQPQSKTDGIGHVTLLRKNGSSQNMQIFCPTGTIGLDGKCVPIKEFENTTQGKSVDGIGHVTLLRKNGSAMKVAETTGGPISGIIVKTGSNGVTGKVKRTGHVTLLRFSKPQIYVGGGINSPSSTTKEAGIVNGIDINVSVYKPIWAWEQSGISLGINAGGGYTTGNSDYALDSRYTVYQLQGQSAPPVVSEKGSGSPKAQGFKFEAGPQMNIHLGDVTVSPILNAAYLSISQKEFTVTETVQENTVDYPYVLLAQKATKTSGLGVIPKVRLAYNITPTIGIWVEGSYTMGSAIATESTRFVMDPTIPNDQYNLGHFNEGQYVTTKTNTKYSAMGISGGIVISLGGTSNKGTPAGPPWETNPYPPIGTLNPGGTTTPPVAVPTTHGKAIADSFSNVEWLNKETGQITYFEYTEDFVIDAPEICTDLGVKRLVIQKGKYTVERKTTEEGGKIILTLKEPIAVAKIKNTASRKFEGTNPKGLNCNGPGNSCFYVSGEKNKADIQPFTLTPVIEKGLCTKLELQYQPSEKGSGPPKAQGF